MRVRIALSLLFGLLVSPLMAAEAPTFASAEAIKSRIDEAMPGIFKRDPEVLRKLFQDFAAPDKVAELMPQYREAFKIDLQPSEAGWRYLGAKAVGSIYRQFVYICQYDRGLFEWRFLAAEKEGRWSVLTVSASGTADDLLEEKPAGDERCVQLCEKIAGMIGRGDQEVIRLIRDRWVPHDKSL